MYLNAKKIPYTTTWLEYPDVAPTLEGFGLPPNEDGRDYTIPAVKISAGTGDEYIMDSKNIVKKLEELHPTPSFQLDFGAPGSKTDQAAHLINKVAEPLRPIWMPAVPENLLPERSKEYFIRTRSQAVGKPLAEFAAEVDKEACWAKALEAAKDLTAFINETEGPFVRGKEVSYADFYIVSSLKFFKRIDEEQLYNRLLEGQETLLKLLEASAQWLEKDD